MQKQDLSKLQLRKVKALKRKHGNDDEDDEKILKDEDFKKIKANVSRENDD